jgi:hypothetical protein
MFENVLTAEQMELAERLLPEIRDFYLAGGTALALQLGHRRSLDFDLGSSNEIKSFDLERRLVARGFEIQAVLVATGNEYSVILNNTRVTFFYFPFDIEPRVSWERVQMTLPDVTELAAMKAYALGRRNKWKDYVDLYFVLKFNMALEEVIGKAKTIFSSQFNSKLFREQLCYFDDIDYSESVEYMDLAPTDNEVREFLESLAVAI